MITCIDRFSPSRFLTIIYYELRRCYLSSEDEKEEVNAVWTLSQSDGEETGPSRSLERTVTGKKKPLDLFNSTRMGSNGTSSANTGQKTPRQ